MANIGRCIATDPVAVTALLLLVVAGCLPIRRGFHPGELFFVLYAAGVTLPSAAWARQVAHELALTGSRAIGIVLLAWSIPVAFYGIFAGPAWVVVGSDEGNPRFAAAGATLVVGACIIGVAIATVERRRRRVRASAQSRGA